MYDDLAQYSKSLKAAKNHLKYYRYFEDRIEGLYKSGVFYKKIRVFRDAFRRYLKESSLLKIISGKGSSLLSISDSKIVGRLIRSGGIKKEKAGSYFKHSGIAVFIHDVRNDLYTKPVKTISMIVFAALITNMAILISLKIEVNPLGWMARIAFMLLAVVILSTNVRWKDIKDNSVLVRSFIKRQR